MFVTNSLLNIFNMQCKVNDSDTALYFVSGVLAKGLSARVGSPFFFRYGMTMEHKKDKPFKTIDEQLDILENRNVKIPDREEAKQFLLKEGYYSVINGYKDAFIDRKRSNELNEDYYKDDTYFTSFMLIYTFDRALRRVTLGKLMNAEAIMKTASVYAFCFYNKDKDAYLDPASYCQSGDYHPRKNYTRNLIRLLGVLQRAHDNKNKDYIRHYLDKYGNVPLWVISNTLTFGNISAFYDLQKAEVQNAICRNIRIASKKEINEIGVKDVRKAFRILNELETFVPTKNDCIAQKLEKQKNFHLKICLTRFLLF